MATDTENLSQLDYVAPHLIWVQCPECANCMRLMVMDKGVDPQGRLVIKCRRCPLQFYAEDAKMMVREEPVSRLNHRRNRPPGGGMG